MFSVFKHSMSKSRGAIIGWGLTLAALAMMFIPIYDSFAEDIEENHLDTLEIIGGRRHRASAVAGYLKRDIYFVNSKSEY